MQLQGLFTALVTPFTEQNTLDENGLRQLLRLQVKHKVDGVVALGSTGEDPTLTPAEKERVMIIAVEELKGKCTLIFGTGSYSTEQTIKNTLLAQRMGADAALVVTPYYNKPTQEGLYRHFKALSERTDLPLIVYNVQGRTGQNLQPATLERLATIPAIVAVKEASGDLHQIVEVIDRMRTVRPDFKVLSGDDALTLPLMVMGGHGIISVVSNAIPQAMREFVDLIMAQDYVAAREMHYRLLPFFKAAFIETNPIPIKAAMEHLGLPAGSCRLPLCELSEDNFSVVQEACTFH